MSQVFALVCHETKKCIWIGQGWGEMTSFYSGEPKTMEALHHFLQDHEGKNLVLLCKDENEKVYDYKEYTFMNDD